MRGVAGLGFLRDVFSDWPGRVYRPVPPIYSEPFTVRRSMKKYPRTDPLLLLRELQREAVSILKSRRLRGKQFRW